MSEKLPLFNWSLKKLLDTETSSFNKAKIKILFLFLSLSLFKVLIVIVATLYEGQYDQLIRAVILLVLYTVIMKVLLSNKSSVESLTHILICVGILLIYSNVMIMAQSVNLVTVQFLFIMIMSSFYILNQKFGILYSCLGIVPVVIYSFFSEWKPLRFNISPQEITQPVQFIIIVLNFVTIVAVHYLYHKAFKINLTEKELLNDSLTEQNELIKKFSFITSHELRHEFSKMLMLIGNAKSNKVETDDLNALFNEIEAATNNMNKVIAELNNNLNISHVDKQPDQFLPITSAEEICLIDDDKIFNMLNKILIAKIYPDIPIKIFQDVDSALDHVEANPSTTRYTFLDLNIPRKSGWEFLDSYKQFGADNSSPVVILSSSIDSNDIEKSQKYKEVVHFFTKPLTKELLEGLK